MKQERIGAAVNALKENEKHVFCTNKDICVYTNALTEDNKFLNPEYNKLCGIKEVVLSRALSGKLSEKKEEQVLNVLDAILDEFLGMQYDEKQKQYIFDHHPVQILPDMVERVARLGAGLKFFNKIPSEEIKRDAGGAKKIYIIQSLLAGWGKMEETFRDALERGCEEIKILLVKPYSNAAYTRGKSLEHSPYQLIDELIKSSIIKITRVAKFLTDEQKGKIELRFYDSSPVTPLFWLTKRNGAEDLYWGFYFFGETALSSPWFRLRNSKLYISKSLKDHFNSLWDSAENVPLVGKDFSSYMDDLEEESKISCFTPEEKKSKELVFFKAFYYRNFEIVSFRIKIDIINNKIEIDHAISGVEYIGLMKHQGSNAHLIAHTKFGTSPRILHLLLYLGGAKIEHKDSFFGFLLNVSHEFGTPHSNGLLIKKYNPNLRPYEDVTLKNQKVKKVLANIIQNVPNQFLIPWEECNQKDEKKEGVADYLFYAACYFADKGEINKAEDLLKKAVHNGFLNHDKFFEALENDVFKYFDPKKLNYIKE